MRGLISLVTASFILASCTFAVDLKPVSERPKDVSPLPLTVGVYYSSGFRNAKFARSHGSDLYNVPLGKVDPTFFDGVFPMIFEKVVPVQSPPPLSEDSPPVIAVIEPRVDAFDVDIPWIPFATLTADIYYRFTLYSKDGTPFASWKVKGHGETNQKLSDLTFSTVIGRAVEACMQDAATKFVTGFRDVPEIRQWLQRVEVNEGK